jgi:acyl carrier protein
MSDILERLQPIFQEVLDQPTLRVTEADSGNTVAGWDSLAHITLVAAIEHEFKVRFALGELEELKNLGDMIALIETKRAC